ncbi:MAG: hypothetical protein JXR79_06955 [Nitrospirae bacterium]|nr:hypothetical protein [Nitrospirota bacterium]
MTLQENDRLLKCGYCRVELYITSEGCMRYCIPCSAPVEQIIYVPYWRFRGAAFYCTIPTMRHSFIDSTYIAADIKNIPEALGLRPQALKLRFASTDIKAAAFLPETSFKETLPLIQQRLSIAENISMITNVYYKEFIGENLSLIYAPYLLKGNMLYDAVLNRPAASIDPELQETLLTGDKQLKWKASFIPTLCPNCGADIKCTRHSLALACASCNTLWSQDNGTLSRMKFSILKNAERGTNHLPFWRMEAEINGIQLASYADLARHANLPKAVKPEWESMQLSFWAPAFNTTPEIFRRLSRQLTAIQPPSEQRINSAIPDNPLDITIPASEAIESIMLTLADISVDKKELYPKLKKIRVNPESARLVYIPFSYNSHEYINKQYCISIYKKSLDAAPSI